MSYPKPSKILSKHHHFVVKLKFDCHVIKLCKMIFEMAICDNLCHIKLNLPIVKIIMKNIFFSSSKMNKHGEQVNEDMSKVGIFFI